MYGLRRLDGQDSWILWLHLNSDVIQTNLIIAHSWLFNINVSCCKSAFGFNGIFCQRFTLVDLITERQRFLVHSLQTRTSKRKGSFSLFRFLAMLFSFLFSCCSFTSCLHCGRRGRSARESGNYFDSATTVC